MRSNSETTVYRNDDAISERRGGFAVTKWKLCGDVLPYVVFANANPVVDDVAYVYNGGGDHVIGLATCGLDALVDFALHG